MTAVTEENQSQVRASRGKYMTFTLSGECYGISIDLIEEIIGEMPITAIPNTPAFIRGILNLRGRIVPVIDLRIKLRMKVVELGRESCILILKIPVKQGIFNIGMLVELIHDIRDVATTQISAPPNFGVRVNTTFLDGIVKDSENQTILLLNAIKALTVKDIQQLQESTNLPVQP